MMDILAGVSFTLGAAVILLGAIGVVRFGDVLSRMHAAAKAPVLGLLLIGLGVVLTVQTVSAALVVGLVAVLQMVASPVGSHVLARAVYYRENPGFEGVDELAEYLADDTQSDD